MTKTFNHAIDELIDLGSVTEETRGSDAGYEDTLNGRQFEAGLTED